MHLSWGWRMTPATDLIDPQTAAELRGIPIEWVGIDRVRYPIVFDDGQATMTTVASCEVSVGLEADRRGTHMSRMVAFLHETLVQYDPRQTPSLLRALATKMGTASASFSVAFPFATTVVAPSTSQLSCQVSDVHLASTLRDGAITLATTVSAEVTSLCPCSKAISDYGAHNQRSQVDLTVIGPGINPYPMSVSDIGGEIVLHGSAPVIPLVKRADERHLTMLAYDQPKFVEDMVRDVSAAMRRRGLHHQVKVRNLESIHSHDAVARLSWTPEEK